MRELKFRAYDKIIHKPISEAMCFYASFDDGGKINVMNNIVLCQFTGLIDKNGKEIYEGDLLNTKTAFQNNMADRRFHPDTIRNVGFESGCFIDLNTGIAIYDKIRNISYSPKGWTDYEVIGNIYENPELI